MARSGTPRAVQIKGGGTVYVWSDGSVTTDAAGSRLANAKFQPGGKNYSQITAATGGQGTGGGTSTAGQTQAPSAIPGTNAGIPGLPGPTPAPVPIMSQGYSGPDSRFGAYNMAPYVIGQGYAPGGAPGGTPAPLPAPTPSPAPGPAPVPGGSGSPGLPPPGGVPQGTGSGSGSGVGGNAGGASSGVGGGGAGDNAGHPGANGLGSSGDIGGGAPAPGGTPQANGQWGPDDLINIGWGDHLLSAAATALPFPYGTAAGALQGAGRAYNTTAINHMRGQQGIPDTDFGQFLGSVLGLNKYGTLGGNNTVANPEQLGQRLGQVPAYNLANQATGGFGAPAETSQGDPYTPGPGGLLGLVSGWLGLTDPSSRSLDVGAVNRLTQPNFSDSAWPSETADMPAPSAPAPGGVPAASVGDDAAAAKAKRLAKQAQAFAGTLQAAQFNPPSSGPLQSNGAFGNNAPSNLGGGTQSNPGGGTTAPGSAGTGGLNNGFGGGGYARGGYVGPIGGGLPSGESVPPPMTVYDKMIGAKITARRMGWPDPYPMLDLPVSAEIARAYPTAHSTSIPNDTAGPGHARGGFVGGVPDRITDNRRINADEGEFVIRRDAAQHLGPKLLHALNDPRVAMHLANFLHAHFGAR